MRIAIDPELFCDGGGYVLTSESLGGSGLSAEAVSSVLLGEEGEITVERLVRDGVCGVFIAEKLGVSQPTASEHLRILVHAGLLRPKRIKQWTFYKRDEKRIAEVKKEFNSAW